MVKILHNRNLNLYQNLNLNPNLNRESKKKKKKVENLCLDHILDQEIKKIKKSIVVKDTTEVNLDQDLRKKNQKSIENIEGN